MLVLTRKQTETIQIGDRITIKVIATGRGKVKLGIDAPANVRVLRGELAPFTTSVVGPEDDMGPLTSVRANHPVV